MDQIEPACRPVLGLLLERRAVLFAGQARVAQLTRVINLWQTAHQAVAGQLA